MNKNNLNRIKGILSAKQGTQIPKFQQGYTIYHKSTNQPLYSPDGNSWYTDQMYSNLFNGNINDYTTPNLQLQFLTKNSNITIPGLNNTTPINILDFNIASNALANIQSTQNLNKPYDLIQNPITGISGVTNFVNNLGLSENLRITQENIATLPKRSAVNVFDEYFLQQKLNEENEFKTSIEYKASEYEREKEKQEKQEKLNQNIMKGALIAGQALQTVGDAFGNAQMATDSNTTKTANLIYDGAASAISNMGPWGKVVGTAMQAAGAVGNIALSMGGGTDQQTKLDLWMDSSFLSWNVGMINGFFGKNSDSFGIDQETLSTVGSSYGGTANSISEAAKSADKKYGLFSNKSRKKANDTIAKVNSQQNLMGDIADLASDQRLAVQSMGEQAGLAYSMMTDGGYNQKYTYAAKQGGILEWEPDIKLEWEPLIELNWELPKFKEGGNIDIVEELEWIPELQKGGKTQEYPKEYLKFKESLPDNQKNTPENEYRTYLYWQLWGKPENFEYTLTHPNEDGELMYNWDDSDQSYHGSSIAWGNDGIGYFIKPKYHDTILYELDYYNDGTITKKGGKLRKPNKKERESWEEFRKNYILEDDGDFYKYVPVKQILQDLEISQLKYLKEGGSLGNKDIPEIEETNLKNVIPEGALHKNKHHMEHAEGLTKKGIPVIDEEGEQLAEIEHSEIIFTLEVTKKLEEYYQIFYSEESTNKEKEQAALDAGKLLVYQILENTEDRTGLIDSCKKGGTLTLKKSTDDLIEEVLEWIPNITIIEEVIEEKPKKESKKSEKELMKEAIKEVLIEILTK